MKIAVLGPQGTFSDKAYEQYVGICHKKNNDIAYEAVYYPTIDDVFKAVLESKQSVEPMLGVVPIENTLDGYVMRTLDLLLEREVQILDEITVPVAFSLVGNVKSLDEIDTLYVQFKALGQCREFINDLNNVKIVNTESNMESYYRIENKAGSAAIVPTHIAREEKERFVHFDVTDSDYNHTRFVVFENGVVDAGNNDGLATELQGVKASDKVRIPVYIMPKEDRPGLLFEILKNFYDNRINLISIMSRPTKQELGTYNFYLEIDVLYERLQVVCDTLRLVENNNKIKLLGVYKEGLLTH